jgi:hypothetical protein
MSGLDSIVANKTANISIPTYQSFGEKKQRKEKPHTWCGGFHVYGNTPEEVQSHREQSRIARDAAKRGVPAPKPKKIKQKKLSPKPFYIESAAREYAEMHKKNGMVGVIVKQLLPRSSK